MMRGWILLLALLGGASAHAQRAEVERPTGGPVDFLAPIEADPVLQHSKEVFVRNGCAYCHGVDLTTRNGEAADLRHSALVAGDVNGATIGAVLKHGIPQTAKLSPMPQFSDLSDRNIQDIARWIHYARQGSRFKELTATHGPAGDAGAGEVYFGTNCSSCHATADMAALVKRSSADDVRKRLLKPAALNGVQSFKLADLADEKKNAARQKHGSLLENYSPKDVADLTAWLQTLR